MMMTLANPWEQNIIDNAIEYSIVEWASFE